MRRIIERVVTVVTTTTWKISWEADQAHAQPTGDSISDELPALDIFPERMQPATQLSTAIEVKEAELPEQENISHQT